jgi:acyl-CoA synthetase (AMP-forming)/AMP-acid ligase II
MQLQRFPDGSLAKRAKTFAGGRALSGDSSEPAQALWMKPPELPLDLGGPVDRPFNRMGVEFAGVPAITHLDAVAKRFPNNVAISDDTRQITYSDFLIRVLTLAQAIAAVAPEGRAVGLLLRHSIWHPIAMLACMAAGRPLVPLNPRDPDQRLAHIVANAQISVLIGQGDSSSTKWIDEDGLRWIDITHANELFGGAPSLEPVSVDAPALVLYTSGSTGQPKGVVNSQRSLLQRVHQYADACHIDATDVFMPLSGPTTIAGTREMLTALLTGARLHMADVEALGLRGVLRQIRSQQITITYIVPALLRAVITASETGDFESLRVVRIGGEKVLWTDVALVRKVVKPSCFIQISYSSTETTGTQWFLPDDCKESDFSIPPVGYLLPGMSFAVVDDNGVPVPTGEVGELIIKSMHVLLGYWENGQVLPALPDPDDDRCRIFPTGDLVTVDARGLMQMLGRKGRQLKINGRRVEPAELEVVVRRIPYVSDAVAIVTDSSELVIFASPGVEAKATFTADVRDVIRQTLPTALHPTRLHEIAELPRLAGGKIDVAKLKALDSESRRGPAPASAPRGGRSEASRKNGGAGMDADPRHDRRCRPLGRGRWRFPQASAMRDGAGRAGRPRAQYGSLHGGHERSRYDSDRRCRWSIAAATSRRGTPASSGDVARLDRLRSESGGVRGTVEQDGSCDPDPLPGSDFCPDRMRLGRPHGDVGAGTDQRRSSSRRYTSDRLFAGWRRRI